VSVEVLVDNDTNIMSNLVLFKNMIIVLPISVCEFIWNKYIFSCTAVRLSNLLTILNRSVYNF